MHNILLIYLLMGQKILIFNFIFFSFIFASSTLNAKTITGKANIIDGDTIHINQNKIRLHGIDAPETKQKCSNNKKKWPCGKQSTLELKKLIDNKIVKCFVKDVDIYNRYVAICSVSKINLNRSMVEKGWAIAYRYYSTDYIIEEKNARKNKLGIWSGNFEEPYLFRKRNK